MHKTELPTIEQTVHKMTLLLGGISKAWVNATLVFRDGRATGAHPGRTLRREGMTGR